MASSKVILDVGGEKYTTSIDTLTAREQNTFFTDLFARQWQAERDPKDDSIFIDRNGKLFTHILEYLRSGTIPNTIKTDETLRQNLVMEANFFRLQKLINLLAKPTFPGSTLLENYEHKEKLNEFYGKPDQQWELIYKASRDGFTNDAFHKKCDGKGPTITIIQSAQKFLFGGYTSIPWSTNVGPRKDTQAFLFTLANPHNIPPTKYPINPAKTLNAVYHFHSQGPSFGDNADIMVLNNNNLTNVQPRSFTKFPISYTDTTGHGDKTFTGNREFTTCDIEVFKIA
ncbi:unnamed protein product [Adineta steineri]|uniref:Uncharacterized protein n=1 Tax=Adineta steineri TaxID=433720 RepID=A0A819HMJ3_9BILA|nr:unnamed protein product [Adineta steineri]